MKKTKKAMFEWLLNKSYITKGGNCNLHIDNLKIKTNHIKEIELRFAFDNDKECNIIFNPTKKEVKKAIHLFGTSVIIEL